MANWPTQFQSKWERGFSAYPANCLIAHRWGMIHKSSVDPTVQYRSCKRCGAKEYVRTVIEGDQIIEIPMKIVRRS